MFLKKKFNNLQEKVDNLEEKVQNIENNLEDINKKLEFRNSESNIEKKEGMFKVSWLFWLQVILIMMILFYALFIKNKDFWNYLYGINIILIFLVFIYIIYLIFNKNNLTNEEQIKDLFTFTDDKKIDFNQLPYIILYRFSNISKITLIKHQSLFLIFILFLSFLVFILYLKIEGFSFDSIITLYNVSFLLLVILGFYLYSLSDSISSKSNYQIINLIIGFAIPTILSVAYMFGSLYLDKKSPKLIISLKPQCKLIKNSKINPCSIDCYNLSGNSYGIAINTNGKLSNLEKIYSDTLNSKYVSVHESGRLLFSSLLTLFLFSLTLLFWKAYKKEYNNYKRLLNKLIKIEVLLSEGNVTYDNLKSKLKEFPEELLPLLPIDDEKDVDSKLLDKIKNTIEEILKSKTQNP